MRLPTRSRLTAGTALVDSPTDPITFSGVGSSGAGSRRSLRCCDGSTGRLTQDRLSLIQVVTALRTERPDPRPLADRSGLRESVIPTVRRLLLDDAERTPKEYPHRPRVLLERAGRVRQGANGPPNHELPPIRIHGLRYSRTARPSAGKRKVGLPLGKLSCIQQDPCVL